MKSRQEREGIFAYEWCKNYQIFFIINERKRINQQRCKTNAEYKNG
jgi:hypothetical protein